MATLRMFGWLFFTVALAFAVLARAEAQELKCNFYSASKDNDWNRLRDCEQRRANAAVALMLLGIDRNGAVEMSKEYRGKYLYDTATGNPLPDDPVAWTVALPDCVRHGNELRSCVSDFHYRPDDGKQIAETEMKSMLDGWSECEFWHNCPTVGSSFDPQAMTLEKANLAKFDRLVTRARRTAMKQCKTIAVQLVKLTTPQKECSAIR